MKAILFQNFNCNYIYFILYFITCLIKEYLDFYYKQKYKQDYTNPGHFYESLALLVSSLSDLLSIIPLIISKRLSRRKNKPEPEIKFDNDSLKLTKSDTYYIYHNKAEDEKKKKIKILNFYTFLSGLIDFLFNSLSFLYYLYNKDIKKSYEEWFSCALAFQIVALYVLSIFILKTHFYKHHYLSILINSVVFIVLLILDIKEDNFDVAYDPAYFAVLALINLENIFGKKAMIFGYISPYALLFLIGVYKSILIIIFLVIFIPIMLSIENNFFADKNNFDSIQVLILIGTFFTNFLKNLFNWILVDRFSPSHLALALIFEFISFNLIVATNKNQKINLFQIIIRIFLYIILFVAAMIHNEIFIITKCGLGDNTLLFLEEKLKEEKLLSDENTDKEELRRYDTMIELEFHDNNRNNNGGENEQDDNNNIIN